MVNTAFHTFCCHSFRLSTTFLTPFAIHFLHVLHFMCTSHCHALKVSTTFDCHALGTSTTFHCHAMALGVSTSLPCIGASTTFHCHALDLGVSTSLPCSTIFHCHALGHVLHFIALQWGQHYVLLPCIGFGGKH